MYYYSLSKNNLFSAYPLDAYLKSKIEPLSMEIHSLTPQVSKEEDEALSKRLFNAYSLQVPRIDESSIAVDAKEAEIIIPGGTRINISDMAVKGLSIKVTVPYSGEEDLFHCRASIFSLAGTPEAEITHTTLILHYETTEKDPEKIKSLWLHDLASIKQNLEWINKEIVAYNAFLESTITAALAKRKKEATEYQSIISKLQ